MLLDLANGMLAYVVLSMVFGETASVWFLSVALAFSIAPDGDYAIYAVMRRYREVLSHKFVHYQLVWVVALLSIGYFSGRWYMALLAVVPVTLHFVHDSFADTGTEWLWPILPGRWFTFYSGRLNVLNAIERNARLRARYKHETNKGFVRVLMGRLVEDFAGSAGSARFVYVFAVLALTAWFCFNAGYSFWG